MLLVLVLVAGNILYPNVPHQLITFRLNTNLSFQSFLDGSIWIKLPVVTYWKEISLTVLDPTPQWVCRYLVKRWRRPTCTIPLYCFEWNKIIQTFLAFLFTHTYHPHAPLLHENKSSLLVFILSQSKNIDYFFLNQFYS